MVGWYSYISAPLLNSSPQPSREALLTSAASLTGPGRLMRTLTAPREGPLSARGWFYRCGQSFGGMRTLDGIFFPVCGGGGLHLGAPPPFHAVVGVAPMLF